MSISGAKRIINRVLLRARALIVGSPFLRRFRTRICRIDCHLLEGKTKGNGRELRALFFGRSESLHYLIDLIYSELHQTKSFGRTTLKNAISLSEEIPSDVVFAEFEGVISNALSRHFLILPHLTWTMDITPSLEILISKMKRLRRRCMRVIQESHYTYEYTNSADKFDFFYDRMYVPYVSRKHGESSTIVSKERSREKFQRSGLFLVKSGEEYVSGILFSRKNRTLQCELLGMSHGNGRELAGQAALLGLIKWAKEEGFTQIDYGRTMPFASDGLFWYKRTWGMQIEPLSDLAFGIHLRTLSDGVLDFLASNPFVFVCSSDLTILALLDLADIDPKALYRRYYSSGLRRLVVIHQMDNAKMRGMSLPENVLERSLATYLQFEELQKKNYCAHVLTFDESTRLST